MKLILLALLFPLVLMAKNYDGHIIKMKDSHSLKLSNKLSVQLEDLKVSFGNYYLIKGNNDEALTNILEDLKNNPNIDYIEPNFIMKIDFKESKISSISASKSLFEKQWNMNNTGKNFKRTVFHGGKKGKDINALKGWKISKGSKEVIVAVLDSGVDYNHPDLKDNIWINWAEKNGVEGVDDDNNGYVDDIHGYGFGNDIKGGNTPMDFNGHGTINGGIIAASDNDFGVMGVAPNVSLMLIKARSERGHYKVANIVKAIDYAINMGATLVTSSIGGNDFSQAYLDVLNKMDEKKMLFVQAAGNHGKNLKRFKVYPPTYNLRNMVNVGNYSGNGKRSSLSNIGEKIISIFAPGTNILSLGPQDNYVDRNRNGHHYTYASGTSMAAPHVAGALALLYSHEPNIGYLEAKERLIKTAAKEKSMKKQCVAGGRLDIYRMLSNITN